MFMGSEDVEAAAVALLKEVRTMTTKGRTTVPKTIRQVLGVDYGGRVAYVVDEQRRVYLEKAAAEDVDDPVIDHFMEFLASDMDRHPGQSIAAFPTALRARVAALTADVDIDLNAEIDGDVAL